MIKHKLMYQNINYYLRVFGQSAVLSLLFLLILIPHFLLVLAQQPESNNYKLNEYGFGAGGTSGSNSNSYSISGTAGDVESGQSESNSFKVQGGLSFMMQSEVPPAPSVSNPANYYNKLQLIINPGANADDTLFAIAVSTDNFATDTRYVQSTQTVGSTLGAEDWQTYSAWGGGSGIMVINLDPGQTYSFKVAARQGNYTQSEFGPVAQASTDNPTLTFDLDVSSIDEETSPPFSVSLGDLTAASVITAPNKIWVDVSTNGTAGALVYVNGTNGGLLSTSTSNSISSTSGNLAAAQEGYGAKYNSVAESGGGPMEAVSPYNGAADNVGVLDSTKRLIFDSSGLPVTNGRTSFVIKAKSSAVTEAASDYTDTVTVIATAAF